MGGWYFKLNERPVAQNRGLFKTNVSIKSPAHRFWHRTIHSHPCSRLISRPSVVLALHFVSSGCKYARTRGAMSASELPFTTFLDSRDRFRTTVNVLGDALGAGLVEHLSRDELDAIGEPDTMKMKRASLAEQQNGEWCNTPM